MRSQRGEFTKDNDDTYRYICQTIVRIASTLGADFGPYLEFVIPPLLHAASLKIEAFVVDAEDASADTSVLEGRISATVGSEGSQYKVAIDEQVLSRKVCRDPVCESVIYNCQCCYLAAYIYPSVGRRCEYPGQPRRHYRC